MANKIAHNDAANAVEIGRFRPQAYRCIIDGRQPVTVTHMSTFFVASENCSFKLITYVTGISESSSCNDGPVEQSFFLWNERL